MWSTAVVLVVVIVLAFSQALPKELYQYKIKNVEPMKSPSGRFGRSCPPMAEGCVGKGAKPWEFAQLSSDDEMSPEAGKNFNINEISKAFGFQSEGSREDNGYHKINPFQRIFRYNPIEDKFQRMTDSDYTNFFLQ